MSLPSTEMPPCPSSSSDSTPPLPCHGTDQPKVVKRRTKSTKLFSSIVPPASRKHGVVPFSPSLLPGLPPMIKSEVRPRTFSPIPTRPDAPIEYSAPFVVLPRKPEPRTLENPILSTTSTPDAFSTGSTGVAQPRLSRSESLCSTHSSTKSSSGGVRDTTVGTSPPVQEDSLVPHQRLSLRILLADLPQPPQEPLRPATKPKPPKPVRGEKGQPHDTSKLGSPRPKFNRRTAIVFSSPTRPEEPPSPRHVATPRQQVRSAAALHSFGTPPDQALSTPAPRKVWRAISPDISKPLRLMDESVTLYEALESGTCITFKPLIPGPPRPEDVAPLSPSPSPFAFVASSRAPTAPNSPSIHSTSSHNSGVSVKAIATLDFSRPKGQRTSSRVEYRSTSASSQPMSRSSSSSFVHSPSWLTPMSDTSHHGNQGDKSGRDGGTNYPLGYFPKMKMTLEPSPEIREINGFRSMSFLDVNQGDEDVVSCGGEASG